MVEGLGFRVEGLGFRVRVSGLQGCRALVFGVGDLGQDPALIVGTNSYESLNRIQS